MKNYLILILLILIFAANSIANNEEGVGTTYYVDSETGSDANSGTNITTPLRSLEKVSAIEFKPGDNILLCRGKVFEGILKIEYKAGNKKNPIIVKDYGPEDVGKPLIKGGIQLGYSRYIEVKNLELTGQGIKVETWNARGGPEFPHFRFDNLYIHDSEPGILFVTANNGLQYFNDIIIRNCRLEDIKAYGAIYINKWSKENPHYHKNIKILSNKISRVTGAGIQLGKIKNCLIKGNDISYTGKDLTTGGDGLWTWYCEDLIAEHNIFKGATGHGDACGAHIDMGCRNIIFQYNLSMSNEGGFVEILGDCYNCVYRYNISINDGFRIKNKNGAHQHGKVFVLGGYVGKGLPKKGPFNNYIYNNTIYVKSDIRANYHIGRTSRGALFANNIIYMEGKVRHLSRSRKIKNIILDNNLVFGKPIPKTAFTTYTNNWSGDPQFKNAGGWKPKDYIPLNIEEIVDQSILLYKITEDTIGVVGGFEVKEDFFGNPIKGKPDMGAIEINQ